MWQKVLPLCVVAVQLVAQAQALPQNAAPSVNTTDAALAIPTSDGELVFSILAETVGVLAESTSRMMVSGLLPGNNTAPVSTPAPPAAPPTPPAEPVLTPTSSPPTSSPRESISGGLLPISTGAAPSTTPPPSVPALPEVSPSPSASPPSSEVPTPVSSTPTPPPPQSSAAQSSDVAPPAPPTPSQPPPTTILPSGVAVPSSAESAPPVSEVPAPSSVVAVPGTLLPSSEPSSAVAPPSAIATSAGIVPPSDVSPPESTAEPTTGVPALPLTTQQVIIIPLPDTTVAVIDGTTLADAPTSLINQITQTQTGAFTGYTGPLAIGTASSLQTSGSTVWLAVAAGAFLLAA